MTTDKTPSLGVMHLDLIAAARVMANDSRQGKSEIERAVRSYADVESTAVAYLGEALVLLDVVLQEYMARTHGDVGAYLRSLHERTAVDVLIADARTGAGE
jgi:hypothetical protein